MATLHLPAMGYGLRYEHGIFRHSIHDGWQREQPDSWLRRPDPWEIARPDERVEVPFGCSFVMRNGNLELIAGQPSTVTGIPFDRPVVGYADTRGWYDPHWHYEHEPETRAALDLICSGHFSRSEPDVFAPLRDELLTHGDHYMHLADLRPYLEVDARAVRLYADPGAWAHKAILNVAASGKFSSHRTIAQYASEIWHVRACPVP